MSASLIHSTPALAKTAESSTSSTGTKAVSKTAKRASLTWRVAPSSKSRVAPTAAKRQSAVVHRAKAVRPTTLRLRTAPTTANARAHRWTVWVKADRAHQVKVSAVRLGADRAKLATRTVKVQAGTWKKVTLTSKLARTGLRTRVQVAVPSLRTSEQVKVAASRTEGTAAATGTGTSNATAADPAAGTLSNGCTFTTRGLPDCGSYLGMAYGSNADPTKVESEYSGRLGVRRTYYRADQVSSAVSTARTDIAKGRLPWISFKFPHDWKKMASGSGDAWAKDIATKMAALDGPVWVAFHHEPEGDGNMADWRAAQERLAPIVRKAAPNVAYTVVLTGWHEFYGSSEFSLANIWPRVKVDVAGFDIYNSLGVVKNGKTLKATDMDGAYFSKIQAWAKTKDVAWGLAETGYTDAAAKTDPDWIRRTQRQLEARDGVAMAYFNTTLNSIAPWQLGNTTKKEAYRAAQQGTPRLPLG
ncbi:hypothetical protein NODU109028_13655 [Nocardioides dubius]|uniref:GH26 domain-containing protein n=1 Tax=Nocardioides dubius TaxID=317019 RepID=A0ABN1TLD3_9ACTN